MATIAQNLQKIINSKAAIKQSILNKGGAITDSTPLDEYSTAIDNLPSGSSSIYVELADDSVIEDIFTINQNDGTNGDFFIKKFILRNRNEFCYYFFATKVFTWSYGQDPVNIALESVESPSTDSQSFFSALVLCPDRFANRRNLKSFKGGALLERVGAYAFKNCNEVEEFAVTINNPVEVDTESFFFFGYNVFARDISKRGILGDMIATTAQYSSFCGANFNSLTIRGTNPTSIGSYGCGILGRTVIIENTAITSYNGNFLSYEGTIFPANKVGNVLIDNTASVHIAENCEVKTLILKNTTPPTITAISQSIIDSLEHVYVPSSAVTAYQQATNWSVLSSIISADPNE